jgi:biopolymer transport protein ExbD
MARTRGERAPEAGFPEPDLLPFLNIIFMLILAMVSMAALLPLGVLSSEAQKLSSGAAVQERPEDKKPLNLTLFVTEKGFNLSVYGTVKMSDQVDPTDPKKKLPLIPKVHNGEGEMVFDYAAMRAKLLEMKKLDADEQGMTIAADPEIIFDVIIQTMDASRFTDEKGPLYPKVSFAAGIVG